MIILDRFDNEIVLSDDEVALLLGVKKLFSNKDDDSFRIAFVDAITGDYCIHCGRYIGDTYCYCKCDD